MRGALKPAEEGRQKAEVKAAQLRVAWRRGDSRGKTSSSASGWSARAQPHHHPQCHLLRPLGGGSARITESG